MAIHQNLDQEEFRKLAIRASRYYLAKQYAQELAYSHRAGDTVEVILGIHLFLRDALNFPITTQGMLFPGSSLIFNAETQEYNQVLLAHAREDILAYSDQFLLEKSQHWQAYITKHFPEQVEKIKTKYAEWQEQLQEYYGADEEEQAKLKVSYKKNEFHELLGKNYPAASESIRESQDREIAELGQKFEFKKI